MPSGGGRARPVKLPPTPGIQNPSWKASVPTFIWFARIVPPTLRSCLPRMMSRESLKEKISVPPWNGEKPRSPRDQ